MESLIENKPMLYSLLTSATAIFALVSGMFKDLNEKFDLVDLSYEVILQFYFL